MIHILMFRRIEGFFHIFLSGYTIRKVFEEDKQWLYNKVHFEN